jgi:hypothetical protein
MIEVYQFIPLFFLNRRKPEGDVLNSSNLSLSEAKE